MRCSKDKSEWPQALYTWTAESRRFEVGRGEGTDVDSVEEAHAGFQLALPPFFNPPCPLPLLGHMPATADLGLIIPLGIWKAYWGESNNFFIYPSCRLDQSHHSKYCLGVVADYSVAGNKLGLLASYQPFQIGKAKRPRFVDGQLKISSKTTITLPRHTIWQCYVMIKQGVSWKFGRLCCILGDLCGRLVSGENHTILNEIAF